MRSTPSRGLERSSRRRAAPPGRRERGESGGVSDLEKARALALLVPSVLLAGALGSQYLGGLYPCEMCHWQRWGHYAAIAFGLLSFALRGRLWSRHFVWLAAFAILASGVTGAYHAGVETGVFEGFTQCTTRANGG